MVNPRSRRVAEQIHHELSDILRRDMKDPRIAGVTISAVDVTSDLEHAKVWYSLLAGESAEIAKALGHAAGFLRSELSQRMRLRVVPRLTFQYDTSIERGMHLSHLIEQAVEEDKRFHHDEDDAPQG
jgi:ribosome-binding factor A